MTRRGFLLLPQVSMEYYSSRQEEKLRLWKKFADLMNSWVLDLRAGRVRADENELFARANNAWRKFLKYRVY